MQDDLCTVESPDERKRCLSVARTLRWRVRNPEKYAESVRRSHKKYYAKNRERLKLRSRDWRLKNPERVRAQKALAHVGRKYGLSESQYRALIALGCGLCVSKDRLCVDHCHATGKARGCLCLHCNTALAVVERIKGWASNAVSYLERHK